MENIKVPVLFQTLKNFDVEDTRFSKVKIWLMHLGENFNGSHFSQEAVEKAIPTLANTPIMGLIEEGDFKGHERELVINENEDEYKLKNVTQAFGVIPEFNNAQFEDRVGDDGVTRTYLTVEGLLWNKWEEAIELINSKHGKTGQSMEVVVQEFAFRNNEDVARITKFQFDGACLLGDAVQPAMINSTVELAFSEKVDKTIKEKLAIYAKGFEEGGIDLAEKKKKEEVKDEELIKQETETPVDKTEEKPDKKGETKAEPTKEDEAKDEPKDTKEEPKEEKPEVKDEEKLEEPVEEPIKEEVSKAREEAKEIEEKVEPAEERIIVGDKVYTSEEAVKEITEYHALLKQLHEDSVDEMFKKYSSQLTEEDMEVLKTNAYSKGLEELEILIFAAIGKNQFSKLATKDAVDKATFSTVSLEAEPEKNAPYNGILEKYLNK